jgi:hypothetical protein
MDSSTLTKVCTSCLIEKELNHFHKDKGGKYGRRSKCIVCKKEYHDNYNKKWYQDNKYLRSKQKKEYAKNNRDKDRERYRRRMESDPLFRLARSMRARIYNALVGKNKKPSFSFVGCSVLELKEHLEKQFKEGMDWNNYGTWHVDHIKPLSSAKDPEEIVTLCHYTNLQPLWATENIIKSNKYDS